MRIFFNTYPTAFQCPGGGEIQLLKSKEALERRGHEVILFDPWKHDLSTADVVHQFSVQGGNYNLCSYVHRNRIPLVLSPILWISEYIDQYPMCEIGAMMKMANVICPNSNAETEKFLSHFDASVEKYIVTHNGVDECFFEPIAPELFLTEYSIDIPFALCVGNIEVRKNQLALLEANSQIGLHTVLVGNIRDQDYFAQINSLFRDRFTHIGYIEHSSPVLRSAYAASSVFILPSLLETPGLAALEAAAIGTPLVITMEGCTTEYFGSEAHYVNPNSVEDIASKTLLAMNTRKGINIVKSRVRQFTWDRVAEELESAYLKAIKVVRMK